MRPRLLWIDEIWCQRRDSSPIIDAGIEQLIIVRRGKVGWRLNINVWHKQSCNRNRAHHFTLRGLWPGAHGDFGFGAKVLNDYFLNVSVAAVQLADRQQCVYTIFRSLADANQQASSKWNALLARFLNGVQALGGDFVGSIVMGCPSFEKR